jgi:hypothetical protein
MYTELTALYTMWMKCRRSARCSRVGTRRDRRRWQLPGDPGAGAVGPVTLDQLVLMLENG